MSAHYAVISFNGHKLQMGVVIIGDEVKSGDVATVAITFVVGVHGTISSRYITDATLQKSEAENPTRSIMQRSIKGSKNLAVNGVKAVIVDRLHVNTAALANMKITVLFCCSHDVARVLHLLHDIAKKAHYFNSLGHLPCVQALASGLTSSKLANLPKFNTIIKPHVKALVNAATNQSNPHFNKFVEIIAALDTCLDLFQQPLDIRVSSKLEVELVILRRQQSKYVIVKNLVESIESHIKLASETGVSHRIEDLTLNTDYAVREKTWHGANSKPLAANFVKDIREIADLGVALSGGRYGLVNVSLKALPDGFLKQHFEHLITDKQCFINQITSITNQRLTNLCNDTTCNSYSNLDLNLADGICRTLRTSDVFFKDPVISKLLKLLMHLY